MNPVFGTQSKACTHTKAASSLLILPLAAQPCYSEYQAKLAVMAMILQTASTLFCLGDYDITHSKNYTTEQD